MRKSSFPYQADITITRLGGLGDGMGELGGQSVCVPFTCAGDVVRATVTGESSGILKALPEEILTPSPARRTPPCTHFSDCGGCLLQHLQEPEYVAFKQKRLTDAVTQAGFDAALVSPLITLPPATRRRATLHISAEGGKTDLGFYAPQSHRVVPIKTCLVLAPALNDLLQPLRALVGALEGREHLQSISLALTHNGAALTLHSKKEPVFLALEVLASFAREHKLACLHWQSEKKFTPIVETSPLTARFGDVEVPLPQGAFLQASLEGEQAILSILMEALKSCTHVVEFFCGLGTYSVPLAQQRVQVTAYEGVGSMVECLGKAAKKNQLPLRAMVRDLMKQPVLAAELAKADGVLINPPRIGAAAQTKEIAKSNVKCVVMVSCNPATFARDASYLKDAGFQLQKAVPIDQFLWSQHLETVAVFKK